jgi:transcriptional regulator with XRE-family HTH domain
MSEKQIHHGRNVKRIREIQGIKQEALAIELGEDWNQKKISLLEGKEVIDDHLLDQVAKALKVSPEAIKNFNDEATINNINNTYENSPVTMFNYQFNPIEKFLEMVERNTELYERLLKTEREKLELMERMLNERK